MRHSGPGVKVSARVVELESDAPGEEPYKELQGVWAASVCSASVSQTREPGEHFLSMIMDSGSEEHVVPFADWERLCEPSLKPFSCAPA